MSTDFVSEVPSNLFYFLGRDEAPIDEVPSAVALYLENLHFQIFNSGNAH